jgi:hypothetical protein
MRSIDRRLLLPGAALLLVVDLSLAWQQVSVDGPFGSITAARSGWHGIGVLVGLLAIAAAVWEILRLAGRAPELPVWGGLVSAGLAAATALFALIEFLSHDEARHWPAWIGLVLALALGAGAWQRLRESGGLPAVPQQPA